MWHSGRYALIVVSLSLAGLLLGGCKPTALPPPGAASPTSAVQAARGTLMGPAQASTAAGLLPPSPRPVTTSARTTTPSYTTTPLPTLAPTAVPLSHTATVSATLTPTPMLPQPTSPPTPQPPTNTPATTWTPAPTLPEPTSSPAPVLPTPTLVTAETPSPVPPGPSPHVYRFGPAGPAQPDPSHPCGCPRAPAYIVGHVVDAAGNQLAGVRLVCYNEWHRYPIVVSKATGEYDFPLNQAETTWYVLVLDQADQAISAEVPVHFDPRESCRYLLDWQRVD